MTEHRYKLNDKETDTTIPRVFLRGAVIAGVVVEVGAYCMIPAVNAFDLEATGREGVEGACDVFSPYRQRARE